jgi:tRNA (guanine-N7-)-methyltransferase
MPHTVLQSPLTLTEMSTRFEKRQVIEGTTTVRLIEVFQSPHYPALFIDTYIGEPALNQRLGLTIHQREDNTIVVGLHEIGFPRPTPGVHAAIHVVTQWLLQLHPDMVLINSNLRF